MSETLPDTLPDPLDGLDEGDDPAILQLPLDAWHRARGGRMVPFAGYEMPVQYEGIMAEHLCGSANRRDCSTSAIWGKSA